MKSKPEYYIERIVYNEDRTEYRIEKTPITLRELNDFMEKPVVHTYERQVCIVCGKPMWFYGNPYEEKFNTFECLNCVREGGQ